MELVLFCSRCILYSLSFSFCFLIYRNFNSWFRRYWVATFIFFWHCEFFYIYFNGYVVGCELLFSAYLVITYYRICFVQFFSDVSILMCFLYLFGIDELYLHVTAHRNKFLFNKTKKKKHTNFPNFILSKKNLHLVCVIKEKSNS
jgi:hypothetical protein